jgi:precorrin-2 dehydrogenase / sirohydrochlorin ferrochelatase
MNNNAYYPIFLDISQKSCLIVGGGKVAERKVSLLLKFRCTIKVVSPRISNTLQKLAVKGKIQILLKEYDADDLNGVALVFAATDIEAVNQKIREDARTFNIPVNVVDNPPLCDFIVPSIVKKDPILIAISTSGMLPFLSKKLRKDIAERITRDYVYYARIVGRFRRLLITRVKDKKLRINIMKEVTKADVNEINSMGFKKLKETFLGPEK